MDKNLEIGKWYGNSQGALLNVSKLENNLPFGYGFSHAGVFIESDYNSNESWSTEGIYEATDVEVFEALKIEATKRGFKKDVYYKPYESLMHYYAVSDEFIYGYHSNKNCLHIINSWGLIFDNGYWAEIVEKGN